MIIRLFIYLYIGWEKEEKKKNYNLCKFTEETYSTWSRHNQEAKYS